jgi:hypothetical protein
MHRDSTKSPSGNAPAQGRIVLFPGSFEEITFNVAQLAAACSLPGYGYPEWMQQGAGRVLKWIVSNCRKPRCDPRVRCKAIA